MPAVSDPTVRHKSHVPGGWQTALCSAYAPGPPRHSARPIGPTVQAPERPETPSVSPWRDQHDVYACTQVGYERSKFRLPADEVLRWDDLAEPERRLRLHGLNYTHGD